MKKKDKKNEEQQARPSSEVIAEEQNIPVREEENTEKEQAEIQNVLEENASTEPIADEIEEETEEKGEKTEDTLTDNKKAVFDDEKWQDKVNAFFNTYPVAKEFANAIGREIIEDKDLQTQEDCLEKALLRVLCKEYISPQKLASDENFLREYIYPSESVRQVIVDDYLDGIEKSMPPKSISSRGQITLTPPSRPKSIAEAGAVIRTMLNNRRI